MPPIFPLLPVPNADTQAKRLLSNLIFTLVNKKGPYLLYSAQKNKMILNSIPQNFCIKTLFPLGIFITKTFKLKYS